MSGFSRAVNLRTMKNRITRSVVALFVVLVFPLPCLVHAYGFYPVIVAFGVVFAVTAARNERRYAALADGAAGPDDGGAP